jgi:hypothetical protein
MPTNLSEFLSGGFRGARGFGQFNVEINNVSTATLTTTLAEVATMPSVEGKYLIRSILATNISGADASFSTQVYSDSSNTAITIANSIPLNAGSTIELIKKPKILSNSDEIRMIASANTAIDAYITYETGTVYSYFGDTVILSTAANTDIFVASSDAVLESIHVANIISVPVNIDIFIASSIGTPIAYIAKNYVIPANAVIELNEQPKLMASGQKIVAIAPAGDLFTISVAGIYR